MPTHLTPKQLRLLQWIEAYVERAGYMPSRREMAEGVGVSSVATIQQHVAALEEKGFLKLREGEGRGVEFAKHWKNWKTSQQPKLKTPAPALVDSDSDEFLVPLLGRVAAGYPIEVFTTEEEIRVPSSMRSGRQLEFFALRVQGHSMIGEGILDGDIVVCEKRQRATSGETVVALLNGEATLKTFRRSSSGIELLPANPQYPVLRVREGDSFQVQGVLTGVLRTYGTRNRK